MKTNPLVTSEMQVKPATPVRIRQLKLRVDRYGYGGATKHQVPYGTQRER